MKKVLFTATVDSHILQFHLPFLKLFKEKGYEVHVATNGDEEIPYCDVKHKISFERSPFKINNLKAIKQLKKVCESEKFDIIHTHTPMGSVVTRLAAKSSRKKHHTRVIYTAHGLHFFKGAPVINWLLFYPVEKYLSKYTDTLILINKEDYDRCKRKFKKCKDIQYVPGVGIDEEKFNFEMTKKEKFELRKSLGLKEKDFVMIYPAELNKNKNQGMIINAIEELSKKYKDIKVILPGIDSYNGYYQQLVKEKGLEEYIKFLGYRKDIPKLLKISNVALATSYREGLPLNVMEAMYEGLPIIATDCRGQRDLVINHVNGYLIEKNNTEQLVLNIEKMYKSRNISDNFANASKQMINEYLLSSILKKMNDIYKMGEVTRVLQCLVCMNTGGAETLVMNVYDKVDKTKLQFDFLTSLEGVYEKEIEKKGGIVHRIPYYKKTGVIRYYFKLKKFFKEHDYRIIHIHMDCMNGVVARAAKKSGKDIVTISHCHSTDNSGNIIIKLYKNLLKKLIKNNCDYRFACSQKSAQWLYNKEKRKISVVSNGIDLKKFEFNNKYRDEIRKKHNINNNTKILGHVGRFEVVKNHRYIIEIFKEYQKENKNSKLMLVGTGTLFDEIKALVNDEKLSDKVIFVGNTLEVYKYYSAMDIFIFPSIYEGLPLTLVEAQSNGLPMVISDHITEEITLSANILKKNIGDNPKTWSSYISQLERINAPSSKLKTFDIATVAKDLQKFYLNIKEGDKDE